MPKSKMNKKQKKKKKAFRRFLQGKMTPKKRDRLMRRDIKEFMQYVKTHKEAGFEDEIRYEDIIKLDEEE